MTIYCKYHVLEPASWRCAACRVDFCDTCSPDQPGEASAVHYCPHCNGEMKPLGAAHMAAPFWKRLTDFLQYPFAPVLLGLLLLAGVVPLLAPGGIIGDIARLAMLLLLARVAWSALEQAASGDLGAPKPERLFKPEGNELGFGFGVVVVAMTAGVVFVFGKSAFYGVLLAVIAVSVLPLLLVAGGLNRSFTSALNAEGLRTAFEGIGLLHVVVCLLLCGLLAVLQSFVGLLADILPRAVGQALGMVAAGYFLFVVYALSGYLLFQFQERLGFTPQGVTRRKSHRRGDEVMVQVEMFLKEGNYGKAQALLKREAQKKSATLTAHERYHKLLWALNDETGLREHGPAYFKMLLEAGRDTQVANLMRAYIERFPGFRPEDPDTCLDLAEAFERMGEYKLAVHVLNGLHKDAPHYARLPEAYLLAARLLAEQLALPQKALALVQFLDGRFKTHKAYPEIQRSLRALSGR
ncbi:MAG: hypothetical protein ACK4UT_08230 [Moraxellaceae bacterium]